MLSVKSTILSLPVLALLVPGGPAKATILTFSITDTGGCCSLSEDFPEGLPIDQTYGDRVNSPSTTSGAVTFNYGVGAEGYTPNVEVGYGPFSIFTGGPSLWRYDYGDLDRVLYQGSVPNQQNTGFDYDYLLIVLRADPGFEAVLHSFDVSGWFESDFTIDSVSVYDNEFNGFFPAQNRVFHDPNASILGAGPTHSTYSFNTPITGNTISILIDAANLGLDSINIGVDNIRFGQQIDPTPNIPEPSTLSLTLLAAGGLAAWHRRGRTSDKR
ncbi:MAG: PEP-CTERM sorting domain-containing protein [Bryobacterales bacterium]|nr:PEP-CTERM sorting domain-containing protein [Bryobacterales bacterium]